MKPYHSAVCGGWGIESRHGDKLVEPGTFDSEDDAARFIHWCFENDVDDNDVEGNAVDLVARFMADVAFDKEAS